MGVLKGVRIEQTFRLVNAPFTCVRSDACKA